MNTLRRVGRYQILKRLGSGGMGTVYLGRLDEPGARGIPVAIKEPHEAYLTDPRMRDSFLREVRLASKIRHPNVVRPLEILVEGESLHYVMEYVAGASLLRLQIKADEREERIPAPIALRILAELLAGLSAAHATGIVHRDVSPHNVLVGLDGVTRITDFGIAKSATNPTVMSEAGIKGKIGYVAPEHVRGKPCSRVSDVYSACVIAWEILAGRALFEGETEAAVLARVLEGKVPALGEYAPGLPRAVEEMFMRGLSARPENRPQHAAEMAAVLEASGALATWAEVAQFVEHLVGPRERDVDVLLSSMEGVPGVATAAVEPRRRSTSAAAWAALFLALVVLLAGSWKALRIYRAPEAAIETPPAAAPATETTMREGLAVHRAAEVTSAAPMSPPAVSPPAVSAPAAPVATAPAKRPAVRARKSCDVPYVVDSSGIRHIRAECY